MIIDGNTYYKIANGLVANDGITLPSEYQRVEYIESTGAYQQNYTYIDTNYIIKQSPKVIVDVKFVGNYDCDLFGFENNSVPSFIGNFFAGSNGKIKSYYRYYNTNYTNYSGEFDYPANQNLRPFIKLECSNYIKINNELWKTADVQSFENNTQPLLIFKGRTSIIAQIRYFKLYDGDTLVRNFIPCYRKSDSEIGMYDVVNGVFYTNQGSGTFLKGKDVTIYNIKAVPYDAEIEYLESDGNQYIETNFIPNQDTSINVKFKLKSISSTSSSSGSVIYGGGQGYNNKTKEIFTNVNKLSLGCGNAFQYSDLTINTTNIFEVENNKNSYTVKNVDTQNSANTSFDYSNFTSPYSIWLFTLHRGNSFSKWGVGAIIYKCSIKDNNTLVHDFIPVRKGNVGYMYDKVSGKLFGNSGTGNFILGH